MSKNNTKSRAALILLATSVVVVAIGSSAGWSASLVLVMVPLTPVTLVTVWWAFLRTPRQVIAWRSWQADRKGGFANTLDIMRKSGRWWLHRNADRVKPSLAGASLWERWVRTDWSELGNRICQVGTKLGRLWVYTKHELATLILAGPRSFKSALLGNWVIDAPGAAVVTSTRADLLAETIDLRSQVGPVWVFNPEAMGGYKSTFRWAMLKGCEDPMRALSRAGYLASGTAAASDIGDAGFWRSQGVRVLAVYLHAAALGGFRIQDVARWVAEPHDAGNQHVIREVLQDSPSAESFRADFDQWAGTNDRTASSTTTMITQALGWLHSPEAAALVDTDDEAGIFDVERFLNRKGTLYMIAQNREYGGVGPLFTALCGYIFDEAVRIAATRPRQKLDPLLSLLLDEVANLCPVPLVEWTSVAAGWGIALTAVSHSRDRNIQKWGEHGERAIWQNCGTKILFGGIDDADRLDELSRLFGDVRDRETERRLKQKGHRRRAVAPERIRDMEEGEAIVVRRAMGATIGKVVPYWERSDYRAIQRAKRRRSKPQRRAITGRLPFLQRMISAHPHEEPVPLPGQRVEDDIQMWNMTDTQGEESTRER